MEHLTQYNEIGRHYISAQEEFFQNNDWSRALVLERVGEIFNKVIVDAGCGHGVETRLILEGSPKNVIAFDPSTYMIEEAKKRTDSEVVEFVVGDFSHIPADDVSVDTLISCFSLHYMDDIDTAYKEVARVLKQGGKSVFVVPHPEDSAARKTTPNDRSVMVELYGDKVTASYPIHTIDEYFSNYANEHFEISQQEEVILREVSSDRPSVLAFSFTKK